MEVLLELLDTPPFPNKIEYKQNADYADPANFSTDSGD